MILKKHLEEINDKLYLKCNVHLIGSTNFHAIKNELVIINDRLSITNKNISEYRKRLIITNPYLWPSDGQKVYNIDRNRIEEYYEKHNQHNKHKFEVIISEYFNNELPYKIPYDYVIKYINSYNTGDILKTVYVEYTETNYHFFDGIRKDNTVYNINADSDNKIMLLPINDQSKIYSFDDLKNICYELIKSDFIDFSKEYGIKGWYEFDKFMKEVYKKSKA